jgi:hypothetical protein
VDSNGSRSRLKYFHINITSGITETNAFIEFFAQQGAKAKEGEKVRKEEREKEEGRLGHTSPSMSRTSEMQRAAFGKPAERLPTRSVVGDVELQAAPAPRPRIKKKTWVNIKFNSEQGKDAHGSRRAIGSSFLGEWRR